MVLITTVIGSGVQNKLGRESLERIRKDTAVVQAEVVKVLTGVGTAETKNESRKRIYK